MSKRIAVKCLRCQHSASLRERDLPEHGYSIDTPLSLILKRMICKRCGSRTISARRYFDDEVTLVPDQ
jgi:hypothetical protein